MQAVAEGLWLLADYEERKGETIKAVKCLEAICQSQVSFLPIIEVKTRLRIATLLLNHSHNVNQAKSHLERCQLLLKSMPSCFELKCRTYSLLSQCYHFVGAVPSQTNILNKALQLISSSPPETTVKLWSCNFHSQLASALIIEGEYHAAVSALESSYTCAIELCNQELQMFFATSTLHIHLMCWFDDDSVQSAVNRCDDLWESFLPCKKEKCMGLLFYHELLQIFYRLRISDYKNATQRVDKLDVAMKADLHRTREIQELMDELSLLNQSLSRSDLPNKERELVSVKQDQIHGHIKDLIGSTNINNQSLETANFGKSVCSWEDKLVLAPPPMGGDWLPKAAVHTLAELMVVICGRPRGLFKECTKRIQFGIDTIQAELGKLGVIGAIKEVDLKQSSIWMAGVYLMLLMQFLENKVAMDLTRCEFVEAQEALLQMKDWYIRFPTILQASETVVEMLRGQYAHAVGCYSEAAFHFTEAAKLTESKSLQAMSHVYAAISFFCIGDAESSSQALDLIGPIYKIKDSFVGVGEQASVLFAYGLSLMRQDDYEGARARLAKGLQIAHNSMGNLQLIAQYLMILGRLALALHDTTQAREILRSSLTLAKKLYDIPTQTRVLSILTDFYKEVGEVGNEVKNEEYRKKKVDDLQKRLEDAHSSIHHIELIEQARVEAKEIHGKLASPSESLSMNLDIPESVGLAVQAPPPSSRLQRGRGRRRRVL